MIAANPELLERDLIKHHSIAVEFIDALRQRGVDADIAQLAARVGIQLFFTAYEHWLEAGDKADLVTCDVAPRNDRVYQRYVPLFASEE